MKLTGTITLQDRFTTTLNKAFQATEKFNKGIDKTSSKIEKLGAKAKILGHLTITPTVKFVEKGFERVKANILSLRGLAAGIMMGVGAKEVYDYTLGAAMAWEQQAISMEHWLRGNKKLAQEVTSWLDKFAAKTPFETEDLFPAMTRGIGISGGDISMAKRLLTLAADMAGLTPGKSVQDAMEALADAQMGEFERLKEFNMKMTQDEMKKLGGFTGFLAVAERKFAGGAEKLSKSTIGRISTITDNIKLLFRNAGVGMLEAISPRLDKIVQWFEKHPRTVERWKNNLIDLGRDTFENMLSSGEGFLQRLMAKFNDPGFQRLDWSGKIAILLDETAKIIIPKAGEVAIRIGLAFGKGLASGLYKAAENSPLTGAIIGAIIGSRFGPVGALVGAGVGAAPGTGKKVGERLPGSEFYIEKQIKTQKQAESEIKSKPASKPLFEGQTLSRYKPSLWQQIKDWYKDWGKGYASGLPRVPYDNYPVLLHRGERVLTASENRQYNQKIAPSITIIIDGADKSPKEIAREAVSMIYKEIFDADFNMPTVLNRA